MAGSISPATALQRARHGAEWRGSTEDPAACQALLERGRERLLDVRPAPGLPESLEVFLEQLFMLSEPTALQNGKGAVHTPTAGWFLEVCVSFPQIDEFPIK